MVIDLDKVSGTGEIDLSQCNLLAGDNQEQRLTKFMLWYRMVQALLLTGWQEHSSNWDEVFHIYTRKRGGMEGIISIAVEGFYQNSLFSDKKNANVELHLCLENYETIIVPLADVAYIVLETK